MSVILPDEHHIKCQKIGNTFSTEAALDRCIERQLRRMQAVENGDNVAAEEEEEEEGAETEDMARQPKDPQYSNSRMNFGRRNKPKRNFIMPSLRQAIPQDSQYVEALSEGQWRCKLCEEPILAAVISAGAIKHFRMCHPEQMEDMQMELCKARLERVSDGCMEFVHPQLIECLICNLTYALHKPYNMCRGIRHLKTKHPEMMPEYNRSADVAATATMPKNPNKYRMAGYGQQRGGHVAMGDYVEDPEIISKLKQEYDFEFDKVQTMYGPDGEAIYVLVPDGEEVDEQTAENIQASIMEQPVMEEGDEEEEEEMVEEEGVVEVEGEVHEGMEEEEEYQMEGEEEEVIVGNGHHHMTAAAGHRHLVQRHQMPMHHEEEVVEEEHVEMDDIGEEEEEREMVEEELVEEEHYQ